MNSKARARSVRSIRPHLGVMALLAALTLAGLLMAGDYGPSWDESFTVPYANQSLDTYLRLSPPSEWPQRNMKYYGPLYMAVSEVVTKVASSIGKAWQPQDVRHLAYFMTLPIGAACLYYLSARWVSWRAALAAALLFVTQPLLFGHAFINPKDTPFMAFFLLSMAIGQRMVDKWTVKSDSSDLNQSRHAGPYVARAGPAIRSSREASPKQVTILVALLLAAILLAAELLIFQRLLLPLLQTAVRSAYLGRAWAPLIVLFGRIAERSGELPLEAYLTKTSEMYFMLHRLVAALGFVPWMIALLRVLRPAARVRAVIAAGAALGLATAIRVAGPFAGVLVSALMLGRFRRDALRPLLGYWVIATAVAYAAWPYLWQAPITRFWESAIEMGGFAYESPVLFRGDLYAGLDLPRYYLAYMFAVQLTEPALALGAVGLLLMFWSRREILREGSPYTAALWLLLPLLVTFIAVPSLYDNGRQYLFVLPPLFLFASVAIDAILDRLKSFAARAATVVMLVLPGLLGLIRLHPYQYIYYNSLVGGVRGAYRQYELDYWATSYKEAIESVNRSAKANSYVYVHGPWEGVWPSAREDLKIYDPPINAFAPEGAEYFVVSTRANADLPFAEVGEVVDEVKAGGATLTMVFRRQVSE